MQEYLEEKLKIRVSGLPSRCELMWVLYREQFSGKVVAVPFGEALKGNEHEPKVPKSIKYQKAVETGILAMAVRLRLVTPLSFREIHRQLRVKEIIGWTEDNLRKHVNTLVEREKSLKYDPKN